MHVHRRSVLFGTRTPASANPRPPGRASEQGFSLVELLAVVSVMAIVAAMAVPMAGSAFTGFQLRNDAKAVTNAIGLAKLRAAATFSRARLYADLTARQYRVEVWNKTANAWTDDSGNTRLGQGVTFGFGELDAPPPNTQDAIAQAALCRNAAGATIANTACIVFNSRGIPIDNVGAPLGGNAFYLTDGVGVRATTVTTTPLIREWWSPTHDTAWVNQ